MDGEHPTIIDSHLPPHNRWLYNFSLQQAYGKPTDTEIQVIQHKGLDLSVIHCLLITTRRTHRCGIMKGEAFGPMTIELDRKTTPEPADCKQMLMSRYITMDGQTMKLSHGEETKITFISHGELDPSDGWCRGAYFNRDGVDYFKVVELTEVIIYGRILSWKE